MNTAIQNGMLKDALDHYRWCSARLAQHRRYLILNSIDAELNEWNTKNAEADVLRALDRLWEVQCMTEGRL